MTEIDRQAEKRQLDRLCDYREGLADFDWTLEDDGEIHIVAHRGGEVARIATIHRAASPDEVEVLCRALETLRFTLGLLTRATARIKDLMRAGAAKAPAATNFGFMAKGLCEDARFWRFLEERTKLGSIASAQAAETRLKGHLNIAGKAQLNSDEAARAAFLSLRKDFYRWRRGEG